MESARATILLVEDHDPTRTFLADNLNVDGYEILEAAGVGEALVMLETRFPDAAIVDLGLPDRDGLELIGTVRRADRTAGRIDPDLPLIVLSGRGGELNLLRGFGRGADDYVTKLSASLSAVEASGVGLTTGKSPLRAVQSIASGRT